jgi:hypothetical protein
MKRAARGRQTYPPGSPFNDCYTAFSSIFQANPAASHAWHDLVEVFHTTSIKFCGNKFGDEMMLLFK